MTAKEFLSKTAATAVSAAKIALNPHKSQFKGRRSADADTLIVLGNGPSLTESLTSHADIMTRHPLMAVNFAANTPEFLRLKPSYYLLADPHFFNRLDDPNVNRLLTNFCDKVDWPMTLFIPWKSGPLSKLLTNSNITVAHFTATGIEGFEWFENAVFGAGLGMPRPRNVLIPSLMAGIGMGFSRIMVFGADHGWTRTLEVNDRNEVISVQPHFYKEDDHEERRIRTEYLRYPLHQILYSFYVAFRSYFTIERYARHRGTTIINATPGSFIDAFQRL